MGDVVIWKVKPLNICYKPYLGLTWSISWLLMPWLLTSPGHQQPWYWLYRICRSPSYLRNDFKYLCHIISTSCLVPNHLLRQCWLIVNWTTGNKFQLTLNKKKSQENVFKNVVCKMVAIFFRSQCVNQNFWCWTWNISGELGQYCGYWCPGSLRRQAINSYGM